jgi:hypothetical protein
MRDRIDDPFAIWVEQVTITERDEQPVPANYNLRISLNIYARRDGRPAVMTTFISPSSGRHARAALVLLW